MLETGCNLAKARRKARRAICAYGWTLLERSGHEALRRNIMAGKMLDHDLM